MKKILMQIAVLGAINSMASDDFTKIVDRYMEEKISTIQKPDIALKLAKGKFEKMAVFNARVKATEEKNKLLFDNYNKEVEKLSVSSQSEAIQKALQYTWGKPILSDFEYDTENELFVANLKFEVKKDFNQKIAIKVPIAQAEEVDKALNSLQPEAFFEYDGKSVALKDIKVPYNKTTYLVIPEKLQEHLI
jgi:hypothetical protein